MTEEQLEFYDRQNWGPGPWDNEPDRAEWRDEKTGRPCLAVRNRLGALCGYVAIDPGMKLYQDDPDYDYFADLEVHGGITYASKCNKHVCHVPKPGEPDDVIWVGFDCAHGGDFVPSMVASERRYARKHSELSYRFSYLGTDVYRTLDYVKAECAKLAAQIVAAG